MENKRRLVFILILSAMILGVYIAQNIHAYTITPWKWVLLPSCALNETKVGIRAYITPFPYPGATNDKLIIEILNPSNIEQNITLHIYLPSNWAPESINRSVTLMHGLNRIIISGVNIPSNSTPGTTQLLIIFERICDSGSSWKTVYLPITVYPKPRLQLALLDTRWSDGYAYPGLRDETLVIRLKNNEPYYITGYTVTIILPSGLSLSGSNVTIYTITRHNINIRPGDIITITVPVDISYDTQIGNRTISIKIDALLRYEDAFIELSTSIPASILVTNIPKLDYKVVQKGWLTSAAYPGEKDAKLLLDIINIDKFTITNAYIVIKLPKGITSHHKQTPVITLDNTIIGYGDHLSLSLSTDIDDHVKPGIYYATIDAILYGTEPSGARGLRELTLVLPLRILPKADIDLRLLYFNWSDGYAYPGEINAALNIILRSLDKATISNIIINLTFPELGITKLIVVNRALRFGDIIETTTHITLPQGVRPGDYKVNILLKGVASIDNQEYLGLVKFEGILHIRSPETNSLKIVTVKWKNIAIGNETFYASPQVLIQYWGNDRVKTITLMISNITNAEIRGNLTKEIIIYNQPLTTGDTAAILLPPLRINDSLKPVFFTITINATLNTPSGGIYTIQYEKRVKIPVAIEGNYLRIASIEYVTRHLLPGARNAEIAIRIANIAPEPLYILGINFLNKEFNISIAQTDCLTTPIAPGHACTLTLSLSIPSSITPGVYELKIRLWYSYQREPDTVTSHQMLHIKIHVEDLKKYEPELELNASWALAPGTEPVTVLPGDIAPLQITIYNKGPTDIKGLIAKVSAKNIGKVLESTYSCSSLPVGASCNIQLYIKVRDDIRPGHYIIPLNITYIFNSYTVYKVIHKEYRIGIEISNEKDSIKAFYLYWITPPRPGSRSTQLAIYLVENPRMVSEIRAIKILLPSGFFNPENNSQYVLAVPAESALPVAQIKQLYEIGSKLFQSKIMNNQLLRPRIFVAKIGINQNVTGIHKALLMIYWVDKLGTLKTTNYTVPLPLTGGTRYIRIILPNTATLHGGAANVTLKLINLGNLPLYNVYVTLIPATYTAYPNETTKYIQEMLPGREYNITYLLNYNPSAFGSQASYTFSGVISIFYETPTGLYGYYNTSVSIILRPPIELQLSSLKAEWSNGSLVVEGIVSNTGTEQAKTVSVKVFAGNTSTETLIGDIDAGSESPFRLSIETPYIDRVTVKLIYHDSYGAVYSLAKTLSVKKVTSTPTPRKESETGISKTLKYITISLAILAILSTIYLYKRFKRSQAMEGLT